MKCPKCYGRVEKQSGVCTKCGFETKNLIYASNKKAKELKRSGDGDLVIESSVLPNDVSKKRLLILCGFLGLFGAHYFYVGKFVRGLTNLVISVYSLVFLVFSALNLYGGKVFGYFEYFATILFAFVFIFTVFDFVDIALNRFKVPVFLDEKRKH